MVETIPETLARRMLLHAQLLDGKSPAGRGREGVARTVGHLGYVQIDTISVIERAHHHTLRTRIPGYEPEHLHLAQAVDRSVFEYWGHAASYLPMGDYRFYLPAMEGFRAPGDSWYRGWVESHGVQMEPVLKRIREEGPLSAREFGNPEGKRKGPWWDWKPAKAALELLFWRGELMIRERRGFERVYDLRERVLPPETDTRVPGPEELGRFIARRALNALGIAGGKEIRDYIRIGDRKSVSEALKGMLSAGEIVRLGVGDRREPAYALPALLEEAGRMRPGKPRVRLLSPFDNLAISRLRLKERFGFEYTLECYTPKAKRSHGYFVLPILFGEEIVGRLDPKADRPGKTLVVRRLSLEPGSEARDGLITELARALSDLACFNRCERVVLEEVRPIKLLAPLKKACREA